MNELEVPFQEILDLLLDESHEFAKEHVYHFSDIDPAHLHTLLDAWPRIALSRKRSFLTELEEQLDADTLLSFDDLARALLNDEEGAVRAAAIRLLSECEDDGLVPDFLDILNNDKNDEARTEAATALGAFVLYGELDEIPAEVLREIEDTLLRVTSGPEKPRIRQRALESLGYSSRKEMPALLEAAYWRESPMWKASALFAMGRSSDERWDEEVLGALVSDNRYVRLAATQAAGELALSEARPILLKMLEEEDDDAVFKALVWSLSQIGGEDVRTYLESLLDQYDEEDGIQMDFIEEALANLDFTDDFQQLDMLGFDVDDPADV